MNWRPILLGVTLAGSLGWYYTTNALEHGRVVNTVKARGDQSAYLFEAQILYRNWHGLNKPAVVQPRNRMPIYPSFLAAIYRPTWSDPEFFEVAKTASIYLSLGLLAIVAAVAFGHFAPLPAMNFVAVIAFGYFVFKAGYAQSELLYYTLHFLTFVACWRLFLETRTWQRLAYAVVAGVLGALAFLTKAANVPFVALVVAIGIAPGLGVLLRRRPAAALVGAAPAVAFAATFLLVLSPYLTTSKRIHGQYFYNINTAALVWYDDYPEASVAILSYGPDGWPSGPPSMRPSAGKYWHDHSVAAIAGRLGHGVRDMAAVPFRGYLLLKPLVLYLLASAIVIVSYRPFIFALVRRRAALAVLLVADAAIYLAAIAFYEPTSGTGTARFLLAHAAPLLFTLMMLLEHPAVAAARWNAGGLVLTIRHIHWLVAVTLVLDLSALPHRLMTTYGGF